MPAITRAAVLLAAVASLTIPTAAPAQAAEPGKTVERPLRSALKALHVKEEDRTGYQRTSFKHWVDADKDGCSTRNEVLLDEAVTAPERGAKCKLSGGRWYSAYDDQYVEGPSKIDIDHRVPLAEAWDSGAKGWTAAERQAYANDLGDERALIAVTAKSNRSKADKDPATWMPPADGNRCEYVSQWIAIKTRWKLAIDPSEEAALAENATRCPNVPVKAQLAR
ncbi:HNH endonuclease family protein [Streptomyces sp. Je 1-369]|uniref:HNH endonuclease family protein n=1 Tax=Streptomyces sp. Je 1-369 TaxID=2966192 RepID=UPI0022866F90|nr:HNH endonuclease family protein [Streptomyces sp. Je 1-369]WAL93965.1 HNH endonuclease family protein [Streptomyces sp. Je 1-369]